MRIKELLFDVKEPTVYCESFVYEPSNVEEEKLGHLFMMGRIRNVDESSFYLINLLASRIKREYYNSSRRSPSEAFETALKEANQVLKEHEERINWLGNLDFFIASVQENKIYFTLLGKMKAFILRQNEVVDLVQDLIMERDLLFPFSTILQANLKKDDVLIFSTSNLFSKEKLLTHGKELFPIEEENIKKLIETEESGVALIIETGKTSEVIERFQPSLENKKTHLKIPSLKISSPSSETKEKISKSFKSTFQKIGNFFKAGGRKIKEAFLKIPVLLKRGENKEAKEEIPAIKLEKVSASKINWGKIKRNFSKKTAIVPIFIIILLILVGVGIHQGQQASKGSAFKETIKTVEDKKNEGENTLIYGDKEKALTLFGEAFDLLNTLEPSSDEETQQLENLKNDLEKRIAELSGRKILSDISPIFEIKEGVEKWEPTGMILGGNNIYIFSDISGLVYKWDLQKKEGVFFQLNSESVLGGTIVGNMPIFLLKEGGVGFENGKNLKITFPSEIKFEDIASLEDSLELDNFQNYFYIFDKKDGEIIKYQFSQNELGSGSFWLNERGAGKNATSIAIDGSIYLLENNGKVQRFASGSLKEEFNPPKTFPKVQKATKIFTSSLNKYLYLLDPENKRMIILDKKGNLVNEYQSPEFENLKDIWVSSGDKKIYLLCDGKTSEEKNLTGASVNTRVFEIDLSK
ncbi:MAG TPA: hypothetical protein PLL80_02645 [Candidatus Pacearchaeota archaeon]|nr:hypothetical protein [Candidatus Pacearchaeota archaeon]HOK94408.1 hypothetical protein [Candidatus Pacearchaeota archaeon]HPO75481.1 hypothetical protein [Candidatus Pacearchaeota archaeon]